MSGGTSGRRPSPRATGARAPWSALGAALLAAAVCAPDRHAAATPRAPALADVVPHTALDVIGDAIPRPLAAVGDAERGLALVADRQLSLCLLCHPAPLPAPNLQGDLGPDLAGVGARLSAGQLRLRVADARRLNPDSLMPTYLRRDGLARVGSAWAGKPVLDPQQIEDVVAWLQTLK